MNIHPIFVHFPIALLSFYAIFEFLRFKRLLALREWFYAKALFLILGFGGSLLAFITGGIAEELVHPDQNTVEMHSTFALVTILIFGIISLSYIAELVESFFGERIRAPWWKTISRIRIVASTGYMIMPLAVLGFLVLMTTGALGGIIVFGPDMDIFTKIVSKILLVQ